MIAFCHSYLVIYVRPYSGFMALALVESATSETVGAYAGLLAASFMLGRSLSAVLWGQLADTYGRLPVLYLSLSFSCVLSLCFGLSTNFAQALVCRCLLGLVNGLVATAKTCVSELAAEDKQLEMRTMNLVLSTWAGSLMFAPAIGGALSEPVRQYPGWIWLQQQEELCAFLNHFPFVLPNAVGALLCLLSILCVRMFAIETLPQHKIRHVMNLPNDAVQSVRTLRAAMSAFVRLNTVAEDEEMPAEQLERLRQSSHSLYGDIRIDRSDSGASISEADEDEISSLAEISAVLLSLVEDDLDEAVLDSFRCTNDLGGILLNETARRSISRGVSRRSSLIAQQRRLIRRRLSSSTFNSTSADGDDAATIASLWSYDNVRYHLIVLWMTAFFVGTIDELFPLFCMSLNNGLGLTEVGIGSILSVSGLMFLKVQLVFYAPFVDFTGLYGSIRIGSIALVFLTALVPLSLVLNHSQKGE